MRTNPVVTERIREELREIPTDKLVMVARNIVDWWEEAQRGDRQAFKAVRGMIFEMNGWLGHPDERIFVEHLESHDPIQVIAQYCTIVLALVGERMGDGELGIDPDAWGRLGRDVCSVGGKPYSAYTKDVAARALRERGPVVPGGETTN